jgi:diguanylate cyclase (GGDEF)-like protein
MTTKSVLNKSLKIKSRPRSDELTGLFDRQHFLELSDQLFIVAQRYQSDLSLLLFDLDHFKQLNDKYGQQTGDAVLQCVASVASKHTRSADVLARYSGEEFILILPNTRVREALGVAENIRKAVSGCRQVVGESEVTTTISVGVAEMLHDEDTLYQLIQRANLALYDAKNAGRNCCKVFSTPVAA